jgi:hypothetical protein
MHASVPVAVKVRALAVATLLAAAVSVAPSTARPGAAVDCVTYYCATLTVSLGGQGAAYISDDQGEMSCSYNAGSTSGTCTVQYYWIGQTSETLSVTVTVTPSATSYFCIYQTCYGPGEHAPEHFTLSRNSNQSTTGSANPALTLDVSFAVKNDGSGRVTSSITGIDCRYASGATSGTCSHRYYFYPSISMTFTATPDPGSIACIAIAGMDDRCASVGQPQAFPVLPITTSQQVFFAVTFTKAHPIVTANVSGQGTVVSSPAGISCGSSCSSYFAPNTNLTLNAAARSGYVFKSWTGACAGYGPTCNLSLGTTDVSTTAVFASTATPVPTATPAPTKTPAPTRTPGPGATPFPTSTPAPGHTVAPSAPAATLPSSTFAPTATTVPAASSTTGSPDPAASGSTLPDGSGQASEPGATAAPVTAFGPGASGAPGSDSGPVTSGSAPGAIDPLLLVVLAVGALILVLMGVLIGARAGRSRRPPASA